MGGFHIKQTFPLSHPLAIKYSDDQVIVGEVGDYLDIDSYGYMKIIKKDDYETNKHLPQDSWWRHNNHINIADSGIITSNNILFYNGLTIDNSGIIHGPIHTGIN